VAERAAVQLGVEDLGYFARTLFISVFAAKRFPVRNDMDRAVTNADKRYGRKDWYGSWFMNPPNELSQN